MIGARHDASGQEGAVATEFAAGVALLVLPTLALVASLPTWIEHRLAATTAVAEAARAVAVAGDVDAGLVVGHSLGEEVLRNRRVAQHGAFSFTGSFVPGGSVTATVTVVLPALDLPFVAPIGAWSYTATHTERLEPHRTTP